MRLDHLLSRETSLEPPSRPPQHPAARAPSESPAHLDSCIAVSYTHLAVDCAPDLAMGDFDSLGYVPEGMSVKAFSPEKDASDMELALEEALARGADAVEVYGALGGRLDHTVANLQLLASFAAVSYTHLDVYKRQGRYRAGAHRVVGGVHRLPRRPLLLVSQKRRPLRTPQRLRRSKGMSL